MKRKVAYVLVLVAAAGLICGTRIYQKQTAERDGYLGEEIVDFGKELVQADATLSADSTAQPTVTPSASPTAEPTATPEPSYDKIISHGKIQEYDNGTVVVGDSAYELYSYVKAPAKRYARLINRFAKKQKDKVNIFTMIVPTSAGITLPDNKAKKIDTSSQKKALAKMQKMFSAEAGFIPLYDTLMQHRTEYLYFRTDHHWTARGAYYAYAAFCQNKGMEAHPLSAYKKKTVKGFLGSFYTETNQNKNLKTDSVTSYYPLSKHLKMKYTTTEGTTVKAPVIADASVYGTSTKYLIYIAGDNPYTVIKNKDSKSKAACVVVKESFGNAFVPYLADHYRTVYVVDYRYWEGNLEQLAAKKNVQDVIFMNNISMTRNSYLIGKLAQILG